MHQHDEEGGNIEGLIFKTERGDWVAEFFRGRGDEPMRCQVDYCPWCGKELK